jgi:divalent metal cation (Fe/Co/Zn/Cd) transporter
VPEVREVHNVELVKIADGLELSLHIKLPRELPIDEAHAAADRAEQAIAEAVPGLTAIHTHIEPLAETFDGEAVAPDQLPATVVALNQAAVEVTGSEPSELALRRTGRGLVALITVAVDSKTTLSEAHSLATRVEETACRLDPSLDEVVVHTEPA